MHQDASFANSLILDDLLNSCRWARDAIVESRELIWPYPNTMLGVLDVPLEENQPQRVNYLQIPHGLFKSRSSGPNQGQVDFNNQERMTLRDYLRQVRRAGNIMMAVIPRSAVRYGRYQMAAHPRHLVGSRKSQLLNNANRDSSYIQFQLDIDGLETFQYGYVDYFVYVQMRDNEIGETEDHYLARVYLQPVEVLDPDKNGDGLLVRLVASRPGRRRRRALNPYWLWISVQKITSLVGTLKTDSGRYVIKLPYKSHIVANPALIFMNEDGNPLV